MLPHAVSQDVKSRPRQLYSTVSGHLYHAGKICIIMVGLPGRGKTLRSERIVRYLDWLGVPSRAFHLANYRRDFLGPNFEISPEYILGRYEEYRKKIVNSCLADIVAFFKEKGGQVAVYDAVNGRSEDRLNLQEIFKMLGIECLFVESLVTNEKMLARNVAEVRLNSPDYAGKESRASLEHYLHMIEAYMTDYEPVREHQLICVKLVNDGEQCVVNNGPLGYLLNRVLMFLLNSRRRQGSLFFARAGATDASDLWNNGDNDLNARGTMYAATLANTVMGYVSSKQVDLADLKMDMSEIRRMADHKGHLLASSVTSMAPSVAQSTLQSPVMSAVPSAMPSAVPSTTTSACPSRGTSRGPSRQGSFIFSHEGSRQGSPTQPARNYNEQADITEPPLVVWSSTRRKSGQTARPLKDAGVPVIPKSLLSQMNLGDAWKFADNFEKFEKLHPEECAAYKKDAYHYRFPRAESYQDVAIRLEPVIMEMERTQTNLVIIAHESVLRVLYGYVMGLSTADIPNLQFPANQVVEIVPNGYNNVVLRLPLPGVSEDGGVELPEGITVEANQ